MISSFVNVSAYAPGRVELLGNHTDYNRGVVLGAAVDRGITMAGTSRDDRLVTFASHAFKGRIQADLDDLRPLPEGQWANYALGVLREFVRANVALRGVDATASGDLPIGGGLSSSAAFEVATAFLVIKLHRLRVEPLAVAKMCQRAENEFIGVRSGLLDQATAVFGRADHVVHLDCKSEEIATIAFPANLALVIADSGTKHSLIAGEYNARREECAAAARALGVSSLREVNLEQLDAARTSLDPLLFRRALHIVGENERVAAAVKAMKANDAVTIGRLMNQSHESSQVNFENSAPALDYLVTRARSLPHVLGSRLTGGGFGGATVTLVDANHADQVAEQLSRANDQRAGKSAFVCHLANGAAALNKI